MYIKLALVLSLLLAICLCPSLGRTESAKDRQKQSTSIQFVDVTKSAGIDWGIKTLSPGTRYLIETMGGGGGFIDYNGDGLMDIYLVCYSQTPQSDPRVKLRDVLYRNNGDGTFTDVTESAGISNSMIGMGMAVGDYNNDGRPDIYITGYGESKLYRNNGNGTFTDVTAQAGVNNKQWGTSAAFFDYDNDGYLDLYVCNYLKFDPAEKIPCQMFDDRPYCSISQFKGSSSVLYHNNHDGTFTDVSEKSGIARSIGKGLGVVAFDYNNDGLMDIFQANDTSPNFLFRNNGNGTFSEVALESGVAFDPNGIARGGMGTDAAYIDGNIYPDIFVANFPGQANAFFHNDGDGIFSETTYKMGLGTISLPMSGFGSRFLDFNNDGLVDLFVLNGHPFEPVNKLVPGTTYAERPFLFENTGHGFREVAMEHGEALRKPHVGRGLAVGDFNNDGAPDLLLINSGEAPALLRNDGGSQNHWLGIKLIGTKSNRDGIGAKVTVTSGSLHTTKQLMGGTSYCAASDSRLLFGLGTNRVVDQVTVKWPSGQVSNFSNVAANRYITIAEGSSQIANPSRLY